MPFKFGLGKARRYNVSSKNAYVVCVHMLDNSLIECTLTAEGTGHDCLQNIAQRIDLHEVYYFGLRYVNKKLQFRWLDLDRPLKRQLDKHAHSPLLYFRVMFFVGDVHSIRDDTARHQYYLQLKMDVVDGKYPCTNKQAVLLGAYSLQVELGDQDPEKQSLETMKEIGVLPRNISSDERTLNLLWEEMLTLHSNLKSVEPDIAKLQYIIETQQLEDYGLEYYPAKDDTGQELLLGASFIGIFVKKLDGKPANYYQWADINNLSYNKRTFKIETALSEKIVGFHLDDPDMVKYVFKMCSVQHKFYHARQHTVVPATTKNKPKVSVVELEEVARNSDGSTGPIPDIQQSVQSHDIRIEEEPVPIETCNDSVDFTPPYQQQTENYYENAQVLLTQHQVQPQQPPVDNTDNPAQYTSLPPSSQYPTHPPLEEQLPEYGPVRLPSYRPAPDYESIMKRRIEYMAVHQQEQGHFDPNIGSYMAPNIAQSQVYSQPELLTYSQPEMRHAVPIQRYILPNHVTQQQQQRYLAQNFFTDSNGRPVDRASSLNIHPTHSTPELHQLSMAALKPASVQRIHTVTAMDYKPPPPYPRIYNSFPDLASMQANAVTGGSPDLISRRNNMNVPQMHQSLDNLPSDVQHLQVARQSSYQDQQEVFITDPPYNAPVVNEASNPFANSHYYGSENPYENLPPVVYGPSKTSPKEPDFIQCLDTSKVSDYTESGGHSQTSSLDVGNTMDSRNSSYHMQTELQQIQTEVHQVQDENHNKEVQVVKLNNAVVNDQNKVVVVDNPEPIVREKSLEPVSNTNHDIISEVKTEIEPDTEPSMGPLKLAAMNGLSLSRGSVLETSCDEQRAPKDERRKHLENKLEDGQVFLEFEQIEKKKTSSAIEVGQRQDTMRLNRFKDVLPYDDTRVLLEHTKENPAGYINASHIVMKVSSQRFRYIAAQGPTEKTVHHFWQMIWEHEVEVIAMLTGLQENGQQKCHRYWPEKRGAKFKQKYGQFEVFLKFSQNSGSYITSTMILLHSPTKKQRQLWHLQYTDWPDHGCPEDTWSFQAYMDELDSVTRHGEKGPIVVHCSAGVGRSGVMILTQLMRACLEHNQNVEVCTVLAHMRGQRMHMVQTAAQYNFVYRCLVDFLKSARLI